MDNPEQKQDANKNKDKKIPVGADFSVEYRRDM